MITEKLKAMNAAFAKKFEHIKAISDHCAAVGEEHRRRQEALYAEISRIAPRIPTIRRNP